MSSKKKILIGVAVSVVLIVEVFMGIGKVNSSIRIEKVKGLVFSNDYDIPIGEVMDDYLADEHWKYFKGSNGEKVVEVSGKMMYDGQEVTARLQFIVNDNGATMGAFSLNDISQNKFARNIIISTMHDTYAEEHGIVNTEEIEETVETEEVVEPEEEEVEESETEETEETEEVDEFDPSTYVPDFENPDGVNTENPAKEKGYFRVLNIESAYSAEIILYQSIDDLYSGCNGSQGSIYIDTTKGLYPGYTGSMDARDIWIDDANEIITVTEYEYVDVSNLYGENYDDLGEEDFGVEGF